MRKQFRNCSLDQPFLLPPCLQDWLPESHLARFVAEVVGQLDLASIYDCYERKDGRGLAAYHPEMLTRLLLYGYAIGESSSRRIEQATYDNLAFPLSGRRSASRSRHHCEFPAAALGKFGQVVCAGAAVMSESRACEAGSRSDRRHEVGGQCE
jgi:transposase